MDVRQFVREVLEQVIGGVTDAQAVYPPDLLLADEDRSIGHATRGAVNPRNLAGARSQVVQFDLSVEVVTTEGGKGGFHVGMASIAFGREGTPSTRSSTAANRVQFSVPVQLPSATPQA